MDVQLSITVQAEDVPRILAALQGPAQVTTSSQQPVESPEPTPPITLKPGTLQSDIYNTVEHALNKYIHLGNNFRRTLRDRITIDIMYTLRARRDRQREAEPEHKAFESMTAEECKVPPETPELPGYEDDRLHSHTGGHVRVNNDRTRIEGHTVAEEVIAHFTKLGDVFYMTDVQQWVTSAGYNEASAAAVMPYIEGAGACTRIKERTYMWIEGVSKPFNLHGPSGCKGMRSLLHAEYLDEIEAALSKHR